MRVKKSIYCKNESVVLVSDYMSGKMEGMPAISTSCLLNPRCIDRFCNGVGICAHCFAHDGLYYKKGLRDNTMQNYNVLNGSVLPIDELPLFHTDEPHCRIEAFGDVGSITHCLNYINICNANPNTTFTMWTKNPDYWDEAIKSVGKPNNLICILSSIELNKRSELYKQYDWIDHVFTVWTLQYLTENGIDHNEFINCGGRKCKTCLQCYTKGNETFFIDELLKADQKEVK